MISLFFIVFFGFLFVFIEQDKQTKILEALLNDKVAELKVELEEDEV